MCMINIFKCAIQIFGWLGRAALRVVNMMHLKSSFFRNTFTLQADAELHWSIYQSPLFTFTVALFWSLLTP